MAPKKSIAGQIRARLSPSRGHLGEGIDDDQEEFNPPLNQHGASDFDVIVSKLARKDTCYASGSASATSTQANQTRKTTLSSNRALNKNN